MTMRAHWIHTFILLNLTLVWTPALGWAEDATSAADTDESTVEETETKTGTVASDAKSKADDSTADTEAKADDSTADAEAKADEPALNADSKADDSTADTEAKADDPAPNADSKADDSAPEADSKMDDSAAESEAKVDDSAPEADSKTDDSVAESETKATAPAPKVDSKAATPAPKALPKPDNPAPEAESQADSSVAESDAKADTPALGAKSKTAGPAPKIDSKAATPTPKIDSKAATPAPKVLSKADNPAPNLEKDAALNTSATDKETDTSDASKSPEGEKQEKPKRIMRTTDAAAVLHTPYHQVPAGQPLRFRVQVDRDWHLDSLTLMVVLPRETNVREFPLIRSRSGGFEATIPATLIRHGILTYYIKSSHQEGHTVEHFASSEDPHPVTIVGYSDLDTIDKRLARYGGHRSRFALRGDLFAYGSRPVGDEAIKSQRYSDQYWRAEIEYTYRTLEILHDFRFGIGAMRARWPMSEEDGRDLVPANPDGSLPANPGVNYGFGEVNFELHRWFSLGGRLILGATGEGFSAGLGGIGRIGDMTATHFEARVEGLQDMGHSTDLRLHWTTVPRFPMSLGIQYTNWPSKVEDAANLSYGIGWEATDALTIGFKIGNAKRAASFDSGIQGGITLLFDR